MNTPEKILSKDLIALGFKKLGRRTHYLQIDDITVVISFERPTNQLYIQFALIPLFMPCDGYIFYDYGNRFHTMFSDCPALNRDATDQEVRSLCMSVIIHVEDELLPLAHKLSTASNLCTFSESATRPFGRRYMRFIHCPPEKLRYLFMYSSIYAGDYAKAHKAAKEYIRSVEKCSYLMEKLRNEKRSEGEEIIGLLETKQYSELRNRLNKNIETNLEMFEPL